MDATLLTGGKNKLIPIILGALMCITLLLTGCASSPPDYQCVSNGKDRLGAHDTLNTCESILGCTFQTYQGGTGACTGFSEPCSNHSEQSACNNDYGCKWAISECTHSSDCPEVVAAFGVWAGQEVAGRQNAQQNRIVHPVKVCRFTM